MCVGGGGRGRGSRGLGAARGRGEGGAGGGEGRWTRSCWVEGRTDGRTESDRTGTGRAGRACACEICHGMDASHPPHAHPHFCARRCAILAQPFQCTARARAHPESASHPESRTFCARGCASNARFGACACARGLHARDLHRRADGGPGGSGVDGEGAWPAESIPAQGRERGERERERDRERESIPARREHTRPAKSRGGLAWRREVEGRSGAGATLV